MLLVPQEDITAALLAASAHGDVDIVRALLDAKADVNQMVRVGVRFKP